MAHPPAGSPLDDVLRRRGVRPVFQPVVDLSDGTVRAYEALARGPRGSGLELPDDLFAAARQERRLPELDWVCRVAAFRSAMSRGLTPPLSLFVNAEPEALAEPCPADLVPDWVAAHRDLRVVVELTERDLVARPAALLRSVGTLRELGWSVGLDDVGAHPDSLALMPLLQPDVIKLDLSLVRSAPSPVTARILHAVQAQAERTGAAIVAEGIETAAQRDLARAFGADLGQGYLFGRPGRDLPTASAAELGQVDWPAGAQTRVSPFERVARRRPLQVGDEDLICQIAAGLEDQALVMDTPPVVLSTVPAPVGRSRLDRMVGRYARLAARSAFVGLLGHGVPDRPGLGLRGGSLALDDALAQEWNVIVVGAHSAAAMVARPVGEPDRSGRRRFSFALTSDRSLVHEAARTLLVRIAPLPEP